MLLLRGEPADSAAMEISLSHALLKRVAARELPSALRLYRPVPTVAFGKLDTLRPGYAPAASAARRHGYEQVLRMPGGHAAAYHHQSLGIDVVYSVADPVPGTHERFRETGERLAGALAELGVDARVGEVPGEYCPGAYSVNARGAVKLSGIGQRMIRGGAHMGGVVVASGGRDVARALEPVYAALELEWDPATSGDVSAELGRVVDPGEIEEALIAELAKSYALIDAEIDEETVEIAQRSLEEMKSGG
jgi:octanoyl-[GcvH]:protein N-octanoyltransferase